MSTSPNDLPHRPVASTGTRTPGRALVLALAAIGLGATLGATPTAAVAHGAADRPAVPDEARLIRFPDTAAHQVLVVDLHTHSVFSDGHVWPRTRVEEALRDGLDALAITEHLEWTPHRGDIVLDDRNRAFEIARDAAADTELMVIAGSEITRGDPVGHINAIFIEDANPLFQPPEGAAAVEDPDEYYDLVRSTPPELPLEAAQAQGAFIFLNHPSWSSPRRDNVARLTDFHRAAIERGQLHGIEVANWDNLSEEAFQIALDHDLTILGVSDVHELIDWDYEPHAGGHRPVTLVLAEERSAEALKEALFAGRTVAWFDNVLLGREEHIRPLLDASITVEAAFYDERSRVAEVTLRNHSDARFLLENRTGFSFLGEAGVVELPAHADKTLGVRTVDVRAHFELEFRVLNALVAPNAPASITLAVAAEVPETPESED